jgi:uncharacterized protein YdhG (YjbR/CyaY superfamily)
MTQFESVQQYLDAVPAERRPKLDALHALIVGLYPQARVDLSYRMPTYRVGERWVAIANQKHYVSLYTCSAEHIAVFKSKHPQIRAGKGCINLKPSAPLPMAALKQVIRHAIQQR